MTLSPTLIAVRDVSVLMCVVTVGMACLGRPSVAIGFGAGATWNLVNFALLSIWSRLVAAEGKRRWIPVTLVGVVKFPVLYGIGFWLLISRTVDVLSFLSGFVAVLASVAARMAIGRGR